mgnify:CR=1 FL=1
MVSCVMWGLRGGVAGSCAAYEAVLQYRVLLDTVERCSVGSAKSEGDERGGVVAGEGDELH